MNINDTTWSNASGPLGGTEAHLRRNESLLEVNHKQYPYLVIVSLIFQGLNDARLPAGDNELIRAGIMEDRLVDAFSGSPEGLFALSVTNDGVRDLFFFCAKKMTEPTIETLINQLDPNIDYNFSQFEDPEWHPYFNLM